MPLVQLISECKVKPTELRASAGRVLIKWLLELSAQEIAGPKRKGQEVERDGPGIVGRRAALRIWSGNWRSLSRGFATKKLALGG